MTKTRIQSGFKTKRRLVGIVFLALLALCAFPPRDRRILHASQNTQLITGGYGDYGTGILMTSDNGKIRRLGEAMSSHSWILIPIRPLKGWPESGCPRKPPFFLLTCFGGPNGECADFVTDENGISTVNGWFVMPSSARKIRRALDDITAENN